MSDDELGRHMSLCDMAQVVSGVADAPGLTDDARRRLDRVADELVAMGGGCDGGEV